jgi:hypothetical protein
MTDHDAEMDAMVAQLVAAGLLETFTDDDGNEVARQLALDALLGTRRPFLT